MALRRLLIAAALAAAALPAPPAAAFYLPGLAPVNFCDADQEKPECKVGLRGSRGPAGGAADPEGEPGPAVALRGEGGLGAARAPGGS